MFKDGKNLKFIQLEVKKLMSLLENLLQTIIGQPPNSETLLVFNFCRFFFTKIDHDQVSESTFKYSSIDLLYCICQNVLTARLKVL